MPPARSSATSATTASSESGSSVTRKEPPETGGISATSSPSRSSRPGSAYSRLTARRRRRLHRRRRGDGHAVRRELGGVAGRVRDLERADSIVEHHRRAVLRPENRPFGIAIGRPVLRVPERPYHHRLPRVSTLEGD